MGELWLTRRLSRAQDMCFVDDSSDVIATVDERGDTIVHRLRDAADEIEYVAGIARACGKRLDLGRIGRPVCVLGYRSRTFARTQV